MTVKMNCKSQHIVDRLNTLERNADKTKYISSVIEGCGKKAPKVSRVPKEKKKRGMSGYNCLIKECAKKKPFKDCLQEKGWSKLNQEAKDNWNYQAKEGCF